MSVRRGDRPTEIISRTDKQTVWDKHKCTCRQVWNPDIREWQQRTTWKAMTKPISRPHLHIFPYTMVQETVCRWSLTFPGVVGQNGAGPQLLPLDGLTGAGLRAGRPGRPVAEHTVPRARHLTGHRLRSRGWRAEIFVHLLSWRKRW